jgi:hypothetical protein
MDERVVITGLSGPVRSTIAFDTLYAEGQRRTVDSLSAYIPEDPRGGARGGKEGGRIRLPPAIQTIPTKRMQP